MCWVVVVVACAVDGGGRVSRGWPDPALALLPEPLVLLLVVMSRLLLDSTQALLEGLLRSRD